MFGPLSKQRHSISLSVIVGTRTARVDRHLHRLIKIGHFLAPKIKTKVALGDILVSDSFFPISFASRYQILHSKCC